MADGSQLQLPIRHELVVDLFAGGGGASTGLAWAYREPDVAINHDPVAIAVHRANHPNTAHYCTDVFEVDPAQATGGQPVGVLWASPDCKHFSKAKGGKPVSKKIRSLAWVVIKWASAVRPRVILLENVEEFQTWGPLGPDNSPCPARKGTTFARWKRQLERMGYRVEHRELRACDYGAPTIRKRLYLIARCDGLPIVWPAETHGAPDSLLVKQGKRQPWRTAAECIDWSIPCPSIFERSKPLADATCRRIAKGIMRYVVNSAEPFVVTNTTGHPGAPVSAPLRTVTTGGHHAVVVPTLAPFLTEHANASSQRTFRADEPLRTQVAQVKGGHFALVQAFLAKHYTGVVGSDLADPIGTVTSVDHHSLVTAHLTKFRANSTGQSATDPMCTVTANSFIKRPGGAAPIGVVTSNLVKLRNNQFGQGTDEPVPTLTAGGGHVGEVRAFLIKYYGTDGDIGLREPLHTVTTRDRFGLVTVHGQEYAIVDIGLRMLTPRELARAQGFPDDYILDRGWFVDAKAPAGEWRPTTKTDQVRLIGNSVCPPVAAAIARANLADLVAAYRRAAA